MTDQQWRWLQQLRVCTFLPGSFEKRFVRGLGGKQPSDTLSEKQAFLLEAIAYRYRRQRREPDMPKPEGNPYVPLLRASVNMLEQERLRQWNAGEAIGVD